MKKLKPWEENGMRYGADRDGRQICRGAQMGRRSILPEDPAKPIKLKLEFMRLYDGAYDKGGAYWGSPDDLCCAYTDGVAVYVRATTREVAKAKVRESIPGAQFHK